MPTEIKEIGDLTPLSAWLAPIDPSCWCGDTPCWCGDTPGSVPKLRILDGGTPSPKIWAILPPRGENRLKNWGKRWFGTHGGGGGSWTPQFCLNWQKLGDFASEGKSAQMLEKGGVGTHGGGGSRTPTILP